jgi:3-oxoacyl-[acyl-carrier-protein] synthase-3
MSFTTFGSEISGITIAVPKIKINNPKKTKSDADFIKHTGVKSKFSDPNLNTSELCIAAAEKLIKKLNWKKKKLGFLIFVSQTRDHILPQTACVIQNKLKINNKLFAFDLPMGCTGFVNSLYLSFLLSKSLKKNGLLLCGDVVSKLISKKDDKLKSLFGDCASAIGIKYNSKNKDKNVFTFGTDGSGSEDLIYKSSGLNSFIEKDYLKMNGPKIVEFALNRVPEQIIDLLKKNKKKITDINFAIFHQANKFLIENLGKKLGLNKKKILFSIEKYGNTNSASIPLTIYQHYKKIENNYILISGFGVGLTWSSAIIKINKLKVNKLIKI